MLDLPATSLPKISAALRTTSSLAAVLLSDLLVQHLGLAPADVRSARVLSPRPPGTLW